MVGWGFGASDEMDVKAFAGLALEASSWDSVLNLAIRGIVDGVRTGDWSGYERNGST